MKKIVLLFIFTLSFYSCKEKISANDINKLNGYWEIKTVNLPDGNHKDYKVNETIDYFQLKDNKGFRQKVMPQFDGKFKTNDVKETIAISSKNGIYYINYTTNYGKWKEEIKSLEDSVLILENGDNIEYIYKRHIPFSIK